MSKYEDRLVVIHTSGNTEPSEILEALPAGRFFRLLDTTSYSQQSKRGDTYTVYEALVLTTKGDAHAWGNYGKFKGCRPYHPGKNFNQNAIYWKGESPVKFIKDFLRAAEFHGQVKYTSKNGFGFVEFLDEFYDLPVLVGALMLRETEDSRCNYALTQRQNRNDVRESTKFSKDLSDGHRRHFQDENPQRLSKSQPKFRKSDKQ